jgi:hypothetical protein
LKGQGDTPSFYPSLLRKQESSAVASKGMTALDPGLRRDDKQNPIAPENIALPLAMPAATVLLLHP